MTSFVTNLQYMPKDLGLNDHLRMRQLRLTSAPTQVLRPKP